MSRLAPGQLNLKRDIDRLEAISDRLNHVRKQRNTKHFLSPRLTPDHRSKAVEALHQTLSIDEEERGRVRNQNLSDWREAQTRGLQEARGALLGELDRAKSGQGGDQAALAAQLAEIEAMMPEHRAAASSKDSPRPWWLIEEGDIKFEYVPVSPGSPEVMKRQIGSGANGSVYVARYRTVHVAVKVFL
jgi:hypothetical protein